MSEKNSTEISFQLTSDGVYEISCVINKGDEESFADFLLELCSGGFQHSILAEIFDKNRETYDKVADRLNAHRESFNLPMLTADKVLKK